MISARNIAHAEYIIDTSNAVEILVRGYRRTNRGRPTRVDVIRLLLIGLYLSISHRGNGTIRSAHRMLTEEISVDEQIRLGVTELVDGVRKVLITETDFYSTEKKMCKALAYTTTSAPEIDDETRAHRHNAIREYCDSLMDVSSSGPKSTSVAIDATGIWSWGRRGKDLSELAENLGVPVGKPDTPDDPAPVCKPIPTEVTNDTNDATASLVTGSNNSVSGATTAGTVELDVEKRRDVDAGVGVKTKKSGGDEVFFGYHEHTMVAVADFSEKKDSVPPLITRFELTSANSDVVNVTLNLLERSPKPITDIVVDRHYSYKTVARWKKQLEILGINQHLDLRITEHGFAESDRLRWAAGSAHCPATPDELGTIIRPGNNASAESWRNFYQRIAEREAYAMKRNQRPGVDGKHQVRCPALAGAVGCPLRPGTEAAAIQDGLRIVDKPPNQATDGEPLPLCCTQSTVQVTPPKKVYKLQQIYYWGSKKWERMWNRRTTVEGSYGIRKNPNCENVRRGHFQVFGLVWIHIVMGLVNASYNTRILNNWCESHPDHGLDNHPLLVNNNNDPSVIGTMAVTPAEYAQLMTLREAA
ncbi:hypothetical protein [Ilumatobacter sp.]|uniref:hypothetical protein n=1 Tax=Ilumatobacter sp. TaxID=1967498 RepID=UPI003750227D